MALAVRALVAGAHRHPGQGPGWDPLGTAVEEAHARGLELHAWFNPYRIANHADPTKLVASTPPGCTRTGW